MHVNKGKANRKGILPVGMRAIYRPLLRRAASQILEGRLLDRGHPEAGRWLRRDVRAYLDRVWQRTEVLVQEAGLEELPEAGSRHNVGLAAMTTAAYQVMTESGVDRDYAIELVADVGWKVYGWMLATAALPARITSRDPKVRMERTLRLLIHFPFRNVGAPGYEVRVWSEGDRLHTHWTHCPPQTFVRDLVSRRGDSGELEAFRRSWCLYDWPGADLLADDGRRGHYERPHTLSYGNAVCDMCWRGTPTGQ